MELRIIDIRKSILANDDEASEGSSTGS